MLHLLWIEYTDIYPLTFYIKDEIGIYREAKQQEQKSWILCDNHLDTNIIILQQQAPHSPMQGLRQGSPLQSHVGHGQDKQDRILLQDLC